MCNLSQGVQEYGMKIGRAEGIKAGRAEGIKTGRAEANKDAALRMYTRKRPIDEIADVLNVSIDEVEGWLGLAKV